MTDDDSLDRIASERTIVRIERLRALEEVARAARPFAEPHDTDLAQYKRLRAAFARLTKAT